MKIVHVSKHHTSYWFCDKLRLVIIHADFSEQKKHLVFYKWGAYLIIGRTLWDLVIGL